MVQPFRNATELPEDAPQSTIKSLHLSSGAQRYAAKEAALMALPPQPTMETKQQGLIPLM
uniref:Uncharacterized protein n=1 Tax=Anopheles arabiensis TaxID=7173 RepID=A0A182IF54_ANOAR